MRKYKFVICGQDCNKHTPKILNCFDSLHACINYLNYKGREVWNDFEIDESKVAKADRDPTWKSKLTYANLDLFRLLFVDDICITNECLHDGEIHIYRIKMHEDFGSIYRNLAQSYA
jgi:hypothetical protein